VHKEVVRHKGDKDVGGVARQSRLRERNGIKYCEYCQQMSDVAKRFVHPVEDWTAF
jgi:hypothetical protein